MSRLLLAVSSFLVVGCAGVSASGRDHPIASADGRPVRFSALGATYEVPTRLSITDHKRKPGQVWFDFTDQNNGCTGGLVFTAMGSINQAQTAVENLVNHDVESLRKAGIEARFQRSSQPMLGDKADVRVANLTRGTDTAGKAFFGLFAADQQLSVIGTVFCSDPAFIDSSLQVMSEVVSSQEASARASR